MPLLGSPVPAGICAICVICGCPVRIGDSGFQSLVSGFWAIWVCQRTAHCTSHRSPHRNSHRIVHRIIHCSFNRILDRTFNSTLGSILYCSAHRTAHRSVNCSTHCSSRRTLHCSAHRTFQRTAHCSLGFMLDCSPECRPPGDPYPTFPRFPALPNRRTIQELRSISGLLETSPSCIGFCHHQY